MTEVRGGPIPEVRALSACVLCSNQVEESETNADTAAKAQRNKAL